ncbi:MAG: GtrA family protein [Alphaproteobacteria bacterium]|nr:GtrA family protein [Alphaproteobacteria bacterium]
MISHATALRIFKFGMIGVVGFCVDSAVLLFGTEIIGLDPYTARVISYIAAASATWLGNRIFTFADRPKGAVAKQWMLFVAFNAIGFAFNYSTYVLLVSNIPYVHDNLIWGVAGGALVGMVVNYIASTRFIFPAT